MPFTHLRTVRLADTDAAGVVFFARTLMLCHEAYEESLAHAGLDLKQFLGGADLIVPISKSEADYLRPLYCGDKLKITVQPAALTDSSFAIAFEITKLGSPDKLAARVRTEHVATSLTKRARLPLPPTLTAWIAGK
ncbi:MAG: thioesterase superfamily protein [Verrucomicrobia bacterium]|nr:thioesterase superfamily protein [Verrucomicrobiota bacterium]